MEEKQRSLWTDFSDSLSDFYTYKTFIKYSAARVLWYFLFLMLISGLVLGICGSVNFTRQVFKIKEIVKKQIAGHYIEYNKGQISTDLPQPFKVYQNDDFEIVIDTTGKTTDLENGVLIAKDRIIVVDKKSGKHEERNLSELKGNLPAVTIDRDVLDKFAAKITGPSMWLVFLLWNFSFGIVLTLPFILLYSLVGLIFNQSLPQPLSYGQIWTVGVFALSAPKAFEMIFEVLKTLGNFSFSVGWFFIIFSTIYLVYLLRGMACTNLEPPVDDNQENNA